MDRLPSAGINKVSQGRLHNISGKKSGGISPVLSSSDTFQRGSVEGLAGDELKRAADLLTKQNLANRMKGPVWEYDTGRKGSLCSAPTILDGKNIFIRDSNYLYSINPETGKKNWEFHTNTWSSDPPLKGPDDLIYTATADSNICALDIKTGEKKWEKALGHDSTSYDIGQDGTIFVGSNRKNLTAYNGRTGEKKWEVENKDYVRVVGTNGHGLGIFRGPDRKTFALDGKTGEKKWEHKADSDYDVKYAICPDGDVAILTSKGLTVIDGKSGKEKWKKDTIGHIRAGLTFGPDGSVYFGAYDPGEDKKGVVYALDGKTGEELWNIETKDEIRAPAALRDSTLYVGDESGFVYSIDAGTGKTKWKKKTDIWPVTESILPMDNGTLYVGYSLEGGGGSKYSNHFKALNIETGEEIRKFNCPSKTYLSQPHVNFNKDKYDYIGPVTLGASKENPDLLYIGTEDGKVVALGSPDKIVEHEMRKEDSPPKKIEVGREFVEIGGVKLDIRQYNMLYPFGM